MNSSKSCNGKLIARPRLSAARKPIATLTQSAPDASRATSDLADPSPIGAVPHLRDGARELVTHHQGRHAIRHPPQVAFDLRTADPGSLAVDHSLACLGPGLGDLVDSHAVRAVPDQSFQTATSSRNALPCQ